MKPGAICDWCGEPWTEACRKTCAPFYAVMGRDGKETLANMRQRDLDVLEERLPEERDVVIRERS